MIVVIAPLQAKDSFEPRDYSSIYCASITENATSPSGSLRLAGDDYCNTRLRAVVQLLPVSPRIPRPLRSIADQLPAKLLILGRTAAIGARDLAVRGFCVVPDIRRRRTPRMMPALAGVVHGCKWRCRPERAGHRQ